MRDPTLQSVHIGARATRTSPRKSGVDPYLQANTEFADRLRRFVWGIAYLFLFRPSPRFFHAWRTLLLKAFGARMGRNCHIYPAARIWAPWNLCCEDAAAIADNAVIYNPARISLGSHAIVSQDAYLCGASHDYNDPAFAMIAAEIHIGPYAWICARATVQMGVNIGEGAVLGLGAIATRDLDPWSVYAGIPAKKMGDRKCAKGLRSSEDIYIGH